MSSGLFWQTLLSFWTPDTLGLFVFMCVRYLTSKTELSHFYSWLLLHSELLWLCDPPGPRANPLPCLVNHGIGSGTAFLSQVIGRVCVWSPTHTSRTVMPFKECPRSCRGLRWRVYVSGNLAFPANHLVVLFSVVITVYTKCFFPKLPIPTYY